MYIGVYRYHSVLVILTILSWRCTFTCLRPTLALEFCLFFKCLIVLTTTYTHAHGWLSGILVVVTSQNVKDAGLGAWSNGWTVGWLPVLVVLVRRIFVWFVHYMLVSFDNLAVCYFCCCCVVVLLFYFLYFSNFFGHFTGASNATQVLPQRRPATAMTATKYTTTTTNSHECGIVLVLYDDDYK